MREELLHADGRTDGPNLIVAFAILRMHLKLVKSTQPALMEFSQNVD
jgi:hypothetical protein